jgi:hypothetical protein
MVAQVISLDFYLSAVILGLCLLDSGGIGSLVRGIVN